MDLQCRGYSSGNSGRGEGDSECVLLGRYNVLLCQSLTLALHSLWKYLFVHLTLMMDTYVSPCVLYLINVSESTINVTK